MQNFKQFTGKTAEEAIEAGLKELNLQRDQAEIRVIEEGRKKLFGTVKARVEIAPLEEVKQEIFTEKAEEQAETSAYNEEKTDGERATEFLDGLFEIMHVAATTELVSEGEKIVINVTAANSNALIGKKGAVLDAVQALAGAVANIGREDYKRVVVDCENYRENREETLQRLANNLAAKAVRLGRKIRLEPMNPYERRIIHAALTENTEVTTASEGKEPNRYIVIIPEGADDQPALYAGNDRRERGYNGGNRDNRSGYGRGDKRGGYNNRNGGRGAKGGFNREKRMSSGDRSSVYKKPDADFFGTFLGNSGRDGKDEE